VSRDRDQTGRARNARPRDALGRPLDRVPGAAPPVDEPPLPPRQALQRAQQLLDEGHAFAAHEVLEAVWKSTDGAERALWRGLAQLCVGLTHWSRGNLRGASSLLNRAADTLTDAPAMHGTDPVALSAWAVHAATATEQPSPPRLLS